MVPWGKSWGNKAAFGKVRGVGKGIQAELLLLGWLKAERKGSVSHANSPETEACLAIAPTRNRSSSSPQVLSWQLLINFKNLWSLWSCEIIILEPYTSGCLKIHEFQCVSFKTWIISKTLLKVKRTNKSGILLIFAQDSSFWSTTNTTGLQVWPR